MTDPLPDQSQKGTIKEFTFWVALLIVFILWGSSICGVVRGVTEWYYPTETVPMTAKVIRGYLLYWWPVLLISTVAFFALGVAICRAARKAPEALQYRSRRWVLYLILLFLGVFALERMTALLRAILEPAFFEGRVILSLFGLVWSSCTGYGLYLWLQGFWEDHPKAQRGIMALTAVVVVAVLVVGFIVLRHVSGPEIGEATPMIQS
jgi:hypothetical protein